MNKNFLLLRTTNTRLCALILFYVVYLFVGASIFDALESPHEAKVVRQLNEYVQLFRKQHSSCVDEKELNEFIRAVSLANDKGVPAIRNVSKEQNWSFGQAVFFTGTVLTTIGYGDVSPLTKFGKLFCILFAIVGLPATLLLLYVIIERLMQLTSIVMSFFTDKMQPFVGRIMSGVSKYQQVQRSHMRIVFAFVCAFLVFILFFIIPAAIYSHIEGWSYLNAFYYCFISLSTVGLGDYVPGDSEEQSHRHMYKIFSTMYLIVGVMVMVWLLQIFSETPEFNVYQYFTLAQDGILTNHGKTIHMANADRYQGVAISSITSNGYHSDIFTPAQPGTATYQRQYDEDENANAADPAKLPVSAPATPSDPQQNAYFSLNSVNTTTQN